jgi:hypothetical protein
VASVTSGGEFLFSLSFDPARSLSVMRVAQSLSHAGERCCSCLVVNPLRFTPPPAHDNRLVSVSAVSTQRPRAAAAALSVCRRRREAKPPVLFEMLLDNKANGTRICNSPRLVSVASLFLSSYTCWGGWSSQSQPNTQYLSHTTHRQKRAHRKTLHSLSTRGNRLKDSLGETENQHGETQCTRFEPTSLLGTTCEGLLRQNGASPSAKGPHLPKLLLPTGPGTRCFRILNLYLFQ